MQTDLVRDVVKDNLIRDVVQDELTRDVVKDSMIRDVVKDMLTRDVVKDELAQNDNWQAGLAIKTDAIRDVVQDMLTRDVVKDELWKVKPTMSYTPKDQRDDLVRDVVKDELLSIGGIHPDPNRPFIRRLDDDLVRDVVKDELLKMGGSRMQQQKTNHIWLDDDLVRDVVKDELLKIGGIHAYLTRDVVKDDLPYGSKVIGNAQIAGMHQKGDNNKAIKNKMKVRVKDDMVRDVVKDILAVKEKGLKALSAGKNKVQGFRQKEDLIRDVVQDYLTRDVVKDDLPYGSKVIGKAEIAGMHQKGNNNKAIKNKMKVRVKDDMVRDVVKDLLTRDVVKDDLPYGSKVIGNAQIAGTHQKGNNNKALKNSVKVRVKNDMVLEEVETDDLVRDVVKDYLTRDVVKDDLPFGSKVIGNAQIAGTHQKGDNNKAFKNNMKVRVKDDMVFDEVEDDLVRDVVKDLLTRDVVKN